MPIFTEKSADTVKQEINIRNLEDLDRAAAEFLEKTAGHRIIAFFAPMGAGKTTFTTDCERIPHS